MCYVYSLAMNRRKFIVSFALLPTITTARAAPAWSAEFISGGFDGSAYVGGLHIKLIEGWKTYWRNPGEAGIPPDIQAAQSQNLESIKIEFPLPLRIVDSSGEAYGYHTDVVLPLRFTPSDLNKPITAHMTSFFGVCAQVCTPAQFEGDVSFMPRSQISSNEALLAQWLAKVPKLATFATSAEVKDDFLVVTLNQPLDDIFVEGPERFSFQKPDFAKEAGKAWIKINGLKNSLSLKGTPVRLTANAAGLGLEQTITPA